MMIQNQSTDFSLVYDIKSVIFKPYQHLLVEEYRLVPEGSILFEEDFPGDDLHNCDEYE
jgi:hypothetical protein